MSSYVEEPVIFNSDGKRLCGIVCLPTNPSPVGLVIVVGGPQYRVGSHRQFVLLARRVALSGFASLRFDLSGMGDSEGEFRGFEFVDRDIVAAIKLLQEKCPKVSRVGLWGLCDGASAALLYVHTHPDDRVGGLCLLNPWVRSESSYARTEVKHYYWQRLLTMEFWRKLISGGVKVREATRDLLGKIRLAREERQPRSGSYQERMAAGLRDFTGRVCLVLSERDYTAKEFMDVVQSDPAWSGLVGADGIAGQVVQGADHTFSSATWRSQVEKITVDWLANVVKP